MRIFSQTDGYYTGTVTGMYEYNANDLYTQGDIVKTPNGDLLICIKDIPMPPAEQYFNNPDYFRPLWYLHAIRDLVTYTQSNTQEVADRPVLKRVLETVLERKFGSGLLLADKNLHGDSLDLNEITQTGRYIIYVDDFTSVKNMPYWVVNHISTGNNTYRVSNVVGLDVFSYASINNNTQQSAYSIVQVIFSNNNNRVSIAVRSYKPVSGSTVFEWTPWHILRTNYSLHIINSYLETNRNIIESLYDASHKQGFIVDAAYEIKNNDDIVIHISGVFHKIYKQISGVIIFSKDRERNILISDNFPIVLTSNEYRIRYNRFTVNINIDNNMQQIVMKEFNKLVEVIKIAFIT